MHDAPSLGGSILIMFLWWKSNVSFFDLFANRYLRDIRPFFLVYKLGKFLRYINLISFLLQLFFMHFCVVFGEFCFVPGFFRLIIVIYFSLVSPFLRRSFRIFVLLMVSGRSMHGVPVNLMPGNKRVVSADCGVLVKTEIGGYFCSTDSFSIFLLFSSWVFPPWFR